MPQLSIIMAAHNEGELLWKTAAACRETCAALDYEIIVVDDSSQDDCIEQLRRRFPDIAVYNSPERRGPSPTKDLGATYSRGEVCVFLDAHCKPEENAIAQIVDAVIELDGEAIVTPTIASLQPDSWTNDLTIPGQGYLVELNAITWRWLSAENMRPHGRFYESPSLIGCCFGISKRLYDKLWGFDRNMYMWGVEDVDFGVKSWLLGHPVLHCPTPVIGHRFQKAFTTYIAPTEHLLANQLRMSYKVLTTKLWKEWLPYFRERQSRETWHKAWDIFTQHRSSAEVERVYLDQSKKQDIVSYAERFGLPWPVARAPATLVNSG